jgi:capsular polysaccharide transport system ATP-binding protein
MIRLDQVTKSYKMHSGRRTVLDNINLVVRPGEKVGILGRNGSGKSTMVRLISGAESPTSGTITRTMSVSWPLAFTGAFQGSLSGFDNLRFICRIYETSIDEAVPFVQEFSELGHYLREPVKNYSSGMRARLAFALSLAVEFDCFLIDEVIAVGDRRFQIKCHDELFVKRKDRAMIIVSHNPDFIKNHCNNAVVLVQGKLYPFESVDEAYRFYVQHDDE